MTSGSSRLCMRSCPATLMGSGWLSMPDPGVVNLRVGDDTMLELMTQPEAGPPSTEMVDVLICAGADLDRALNLAGCWNLADLCTQLLAAGADPAARADAGITPLESAALHSSTEAADVLVAHGLHRPTLWLAAAAGLLPEVRRWVAPDGSLLANPGPCRPNWADVGRPAGTPPTDDPAEVVGEAFVFAALNSPTRCCRLSPRRRGRHRCEAVSEHDRAALRHPVPAPRDGPAPARSGRFSHHRGRQLRLRCLRLGRGVRRRQRGGSLDPSAGRRQGPHGIGHAARKGAPPHLPASPARPCRHLDHSSNRVNG